MRKVILVADDSSMIRKLVSRALESQGFKVITASDGMEALEKMALEEVDLVITDLNMPNVDGYEFISSLRQSEAYREVPVIILSSEAKESDKERGFQVGANAYLVKPFNPKRIQYEVAKFLN